MSNYLILQKITNMRTVHNFFIACILLGFTLISCEKTKELEDDADAFVGTYSASVVDHVVWGYDSGTINNNGTLTIKKISSTKVQVYGMGIYTTGEVSGSMIQLEGTYASDSAGYFTTSFGMGYLSGNILRFTANRTGKLASSSNGVLYPYRSTLDYTAIKQ